MPKGGVPDEYMDAVVAAAEIVGRSGGKEFELGWLYDDDEPPPGWPEGVSVPVEEQQWYATARYKGALLKGEGTWPWEACERLAARVLHGGQCVACGKSVNLVPEQGQWSDGNCNWHREGKHWVRGCDGGYGPLTGDGSGVSGFLYPTTITKTLCPRCGDELPEGKQQAKSQVKYGEKRTILICSECGLEEFLMKKEGIPQLPAEIWPVKRALRDASPELSDDFKLELTDDGLLMDGSISDPRLARLIEEGVAQGRTAGDVLDDVLKEGTKGLAEMYGED